MSSPIVRRTATIDLAQDEIEAAISIWLAKVHPDIFFRDQSFKFEWKDSRVYVTAETVPNG